MQSNPLVSAPPSLSSPGDGLPRIQNAVNAQEYLNLLSWPPALQEAFMRALEKLPIRYFICDDSGSMSATDGSILEPVGTTKKKISCTRWKELCNTLKFHLKIAKDGCVPSEFRFLNSSGALPIGFDPLEPVDNYNMIASLLDGSCPGGGTPLCRHINEIAASIRSYAPALQATGKKAVVIINTDGEPSDGNIDQVLRPFKELPAWVVLRFCTNEDSIVDKWGKVESDLELNMDVLDDYLGEAQEIHKKNPWLTYGEPLHRMREFGVTLKELDKIDEARLSTEEMVRVCKLIFGAVVDSFPNPQADLNGFISKLNEANALIPKVFCPISKTLKAWIDTGKLRSSYSSGGCCTIN